MVLRRGRKWQDFTKNMQSWDFLHFWSNYMISTHSMYFSGNPALPARAQETSINPMQFHRVLRGASRWNSLQSPEIANSLGICTFLWKWEKILWNCDSSGFFANVSENGPQKPIESYWFHCCSCTGAGEGGFTQRKHWISWFHSIFREITWFPHISCIFAKICLPWPPA